VNMGASGKFRWLDGYEWIIAAYALLSWALARRYGFEIDYAIALDFRYDAGFLVALALLASLALIASGLRARWIGGLAFGPAWRQRVRREYFTAQRAWDLARVLVLLKLVLTVYGNLKQAIPRMHPELFDEELLRADVAAHLGLNPMRATADLLARLGLVRAFDTLYVVWYAIKIPMLVVFVLVEDRALRAAFFGAYFSLWILGGLLAVLWPSLGPIYVHPEWFAGLDKPVASELQHQLWVHYQASLADPEHYRALIYEGIAAFPSLHVGIAALFALFLGRLHRWAGISMWIYTAIVQIGSVVLGWHYAIDGYAGILLAVALWALFTRAKAPWKRERAAAEATARV
jgi:membrane-associated phospholipid phosphatase